MYDPHFLEQEKEKVNHAKNPSKIEFKVKL